MIFFTKRKQKKVSYWPDLVLFSKGSSSLGLPASSPGPPPPPLWSRFVRMGEVCCWTTVAGGVGVVGGVGPVVVDDVTMLLAPGGAALYTVVPWMT